MLRRTSEQWQTLFDQHKASGLTQTEFAQQGIDPSYFSLRKRKLLAWQQATTTALLSNTLWHSVLPTAVAQKAGY
ncbi:hypothetical protein Rhein_0434 [Rheinheimera sp. A13L]|uniref:IS66 family insertion sequence element accessory protein TnpA n=1 Tax=Rheinheimera sp. A13L TaxID=506534 RepID=UPI0002124818|nr:hypothetical protein [Rheinheimera sp. A13L]EGM79299.1 hypothetical protein Rhein_0434 [Rheinheimera sp. A13L]